MKRWLGANTRSRRLAIAVAVYVVVVVVYFAIVPKNRIIEHTSFNHFALLAEAWLDGHLALDGGPPPYAQNNDFAKFEGKWYVAFPPFPAVLLVPVVAVAGDSTNVRDGQIFLWLAGIGPAVLFLVLEKLRRTERSDRTEKQNVVLALLFAFGTVYFFTALQGTVWFAAHVVAVGVCALYLLVALDAERPLVAGALIGVGFLTRTPLLFAFPLFVYEALRKTSRPFAEGEPAPMGLGAELRSLMRRMSFRPLFVRCVLFAVPIVLCLAFTLWHNQARFGDPFNHGYEYLTVAWQARMKKWGLFDYHYLARNLGVVLTSLPWKTEGGAAPFQINAHGLALWVTTPLYLWLLWPKRVRGLELALYLSAFGVAVPGLFYQNTGWIQFGYRFSNDYAPFLFVLLATTNRPMRALFYAASVWSIAVNAFGAHTFDRGHFRKFYYEDRSQKILYQPD